MGFMENFMESNVCPDKGQFSNGIWQGSSQEQVASQERDSGNGIEIADCLAGFAVQKQRVRLVDAGQKNFGNVDMRGSRCGPQNRFGNVGGRQGGHSPVNLGGALFISVEAHAAELRLRHSGVNRGDADRCAQQIHAQPFADAIFRRFGGAVDRSAGIGDAPCRRANVQDMSPASLHHARHNRARDVEKPLDVSVDHLLPIGNFSLVELVQTTAQASVVDQNVDVLPCGGQSGQGRFHLSAIANIQRKHDDLRSAFRLQLRLHIVQTLHAPRRQQQARALGGKTMGAGGSDAGAGPGDKDDLSLESLHGCVLRRNQNSTDGHRAGFLAIGQQPSLYRPQAQNPLILIRRTTYLPSQQFPKAPPRWYTTFTRRCGAIAQLGERLVRNEEVSGSIPLSSTKLSFARQVRVAGARIHRRQAGMTATMYPVPSLACPESNMRLRDAFGRAITDLRISITDHCNYKCVYCRTGKEGAQYAELPIADYLRMTRVFVSLGLEKIRLTGGEPLLRNGLIEMVQELSTYRTAFDTNDAPLAEGAGKPLDIALTTNGHLLEDLAQPLKDAGLHRITVSMDAVDREKFAQITRVTDGYDRVLAGIRAAKRVGLAPVKVNCVLLRGFNEDQIVAFARFSRDEGVIVRFIEFMPLEEDRRWTPEVVVRLEEILRALNEFRPVVPLPPQTLSETARRYTFDDGQGEIGIIAPVSHPFCGHCSRIRLTSDGKIRTCLFSQFDHDLYGVLHRGGGDDDLAAMIRRTVEHKEARHHIGESGFLKPSRSMVHIGG